MVPDGWEQHPIGDFLTESRIPGSDGLTADKITVKLYGKGVYAKDEKRLGSASTKYYKRQVGQFIYSKLDFLNGAFGIIPEELDGYESTLDLPTFDLSPQIDAQWLLSYVAREIFYRAHIGLAKGGRKARRVSPSEFLSIEIPFPPLSEQKKIAAILSSVDDTIQATQAVIDQTRTVKQGLMKQLLARGIGHTRFKQTEIGVIPDDWQVQNLADKALIILGQSPPSSACNETVKGYPFYQGNADFGYLHPLPQRWIEDPLKVARKDDILISVRAPVGELNIANTDCCIGRGVGAIRPLSANRDFVYYTLLNARNSLASVSQGSTFDAINGKELRNLPLLIPPLPEQKRIAAILSSVDENIQTEQAKLQQNIKIKRGLLQDLLSGRVRVNSVK